MTNYAKSAKQVLAQIKCPYLDLVRVTGREGGYWYFVYDDIANGIYETESVYVMRLNDMALDRWVASGKDLVAMCEAKLAERNDPEYRNMSMIYKNMETK